MKRTDFDVELNESWAGTRIIDGTQGLRRDQGKKRPTLENRGWAPFAVFWFLVWLGSAACQWNNADQVDQTWRGFLGFGFVELGGLSGEAPSCHGKNLHECCEGRVSYEVL